MTDKELQEAFTELLDKVKEVSKQKDKELQGAVEKLVPLDTFKEKLEEISKLSQRVEEGETIFRTFVVVLANNSFKERGDNSLL